MCSRVRLDRIASHSFPEIPIQLLANFKKILYLKFRATLTFRKFKVALNSMYRIFLNVAKSCNLSCLSKFHNKKKFHRAPFLKHKRLKLKLRVFLAGNSVAMVSYCVKKIIPTCFPVIGQLF